MIKNFQIAKISSKKNGNLEARNLILCPILKAGNKNNMDVNNVRII